MLSPLLWLMRVEADASQTKDLRVDFQGSWDTWGWESTHTQADEYRILQTWRNVRDKDLDCCPRHTKNMKISVIHFFLLYNYVATWENWV